MHDACRAVRGSAAIKKTRCATAEAESLFRVGRQSAYDVQCIACRQIDVMVDKGGAHSHYYPRRVARSKKRSTVEHSTMTPLKKGHFPTSSGESRAPERRFRRKGSSTYFGPFLAPAHEWGSRTGPPWPVRSGTCTRARVGITLPLAALSLPIIGANRRQREAGGVGVGS